MKNNFLKNKKILFLSWTFYQYPEQIKRTIEKMGAKVTYYNSNPINDFIGENVFQMIRPLRKRYFFQIIDREKENKYDYVFMINAASFPEYFIAELKNMFPTAKRILYCWDAIKTFPQVKEVYHYFDEVYSFDSSDVENNPNLKFLPLFYCDELYDETINGIRYDFSFIGFGHSERYKFLKTIQTFSEACGYNYYFKLYLRSKLHYLNGKYVKKIFPDAKLQDFIYKQISQENIKNVTNMSRIVVDLELKEQSGLTMRTIEAHGIRKKLITTNANIRKYDFYNDNNILVVDRNNPVITKEFVEAEYEILPNELYEKYSLSSWINSIFCTD